MIDKLVLGYRERIELNFMEAEVFIPDYKKNKVIRFTDMDNRENRIIVDYEDLKAIVAMIESND